METLERETKTKKKKKGKAGHVAAFLLILAALNLGIGELLELPKHDLVAKGKFDPKLRWEEFYSLPANSVDVLFLGSSHSYRSFNPATFDEIAKAGRSFNLGSSAQTPQTAYFVLKEALKTQKPKVLIYEIFFQAFENGEQFVNATYNWEFIRSPGVRSEFLFRGYSPRDWVYFFLPPLRYRLNAADTVRLLLGKPIEYEEDFYAGRGYVENTEVVSEDKLRRSKMFERYRTAAPEFKEKQLEYFGKIRRLAREHGIRMIFVTSPLPEISRAKVTGYEEIHAFFRRTADAEGIPYLDYNLIDAEEKLFPADNYKDEDHLNKAGAEKLTADFARRVEPHLAAAVKNPA